MRNLAMKNAMPWLVLAMPIPSWAARVYPNHPEDIRMEKLWNAVFEMSRLNKADPLTAWQRHLDELEARSAFLNHKQYETLHYYGEGTDLYVGLPQGHCWIGGREVSRDGIAFMPNVPTEEVFCAPHVERVDGHVTSSIPCDIRGVVVDKFTLTFQTGRIVRVSASNAPEVLEKYLATDEGSARLGEVALVPHSNPIAKMGTIFYNGLIDENAACHLALGSAYPKNVQGGVAMSPEKLAERGLNVSLNHLDFMVGSGTLNLDGILASGAREAILRNGEWVFTVAQ
jgi:aminopeptidase